MKLRYGMGKQEWKNLMGQLQNTEGVTLTYFAETDNDGMFVDFKYLTFEYNGFFYYLQESWDVFEGISMTAYLKVSPYEKRQGKYPVKVSSSDDIIKYINLNHNATPIKDTHKQRIYLLELYGMSEGTTTLSKLANQWAGFREKDIMSNLDRIEMVMNTKYYTLLRFHHKNGIDYFDFETKSKRITG